MEVFTKLWKAFSRLAATLNRLADVGDAVASEAEHRLLKASPAAQTRKPVRVAIGVSAPPDSPTGRVDAAKGKRKHLANGVKAETNGHK